MNDEMLTTYLYINQFDGTIWNDILRTIRKRHNRDNWIYTQRNWNGNKIKYISAECQEWIEMVYQNEGNWLDKEIKFSLIKINEYLSIDKLVHYLGYKDSTIKEVSQILNTDISRIYKKVKIMELEYQELSYTNQDNVLCLEAKGVELLESKYLKKIYWKRLEEFRICEMLNLRLKKTVII